MTALALVPNRFTRLFLMANDRDNPAEVSGLLREFLDSQKRDEKRRFEERSAEHTEVAENVKKGSDKIFGAMQALSIDVGNKLEDIRREFGRELKKVNKRIEEVAHVAFRANERIDKLEQRKEITYTAKSVIRELGTESDTGSWKISKETLEQYDLAKEVGTWRWIKQNATKIAVTMISTLATTYLVLKLFKEAGIHLL